MRDAKKRVRQRWSYDERSRSLDPIERGILDALWDDPQMPISRIAQRVGSSDLTVASRLDALVSEKLIRVTVQRDMRTLGYEILGFVDIWVEGKDAYEVGQTIGELPQVFSATVLMGHPQLFVQLMAKDLREFVSIVEGKISAIPGVSRADTSICLDVAVARTGIAAIV